MATDVKSVVWKARIAAARALHAVRVRFRKHPPPAILMYHRIDEDRFDPWSLSVSPERFRVQVEWLKRHRTVMPLTEFVARLRSGTLASDAVAITFDDGYASVGDVAVPILEDLGLPATIFLPAALICDGDPFWWDDLETIVLHHEDDRLEVDGETVDLGPRSTRDADWKPRSKAATPRQQAFERIQHWMSKQSRDVIETSMSSLREQAKLADDAPPTRRPLRAAELNTMAGKTIQFGSHALSHPWLPLVTAAERATEIRDSMAACQSLTGERPQIFAYPYGAYDPDCERLVESSGYLAACATLDAAVRGCGNPYALPRFQVENWTATQLETALRRARAV